MTEFITFIVSLLLAFFVPGSLAIHRFQTSVFNKLVLSFMVGMVLWGWQEYLVGLLNIRWATYVYLPITFFFFWYFSHKNKYKIPKIRINLGTITMILIIIAGVIIQTSYVVYQGVRMPKGLFFCCGNVSDSIYHAALTQQLVFRYPPFEPGMYGVIVHNYHYWSNAVVAGLVRVFHLPLLITQFQFMGTFVSLFLGLTAIVFANIARLSKLFKIWVLFFLYFGSDLTYLFVSIMRRQLTFAMSSLEDGSIFLVNPPRAYSIVVFFAGLSLFLLWIKQKNRFNTVLLALVFASLTGFKVYTGLFSLFGLFFVVIYDLWNKRKESLLLLIVQLLLCVFIYLPVNAGAGGFYFTGFYIFENFIQQGWLMLGQLELRRQVYIAHSNILRLVQYELMYMVLFITTVFGFKLLGFLQTRNSLGVLPKTFHVFLIGGLIPSALLGFFFQQNSGGSNTFNFLVLIFIISSVYAALACDYWAHKFPKFIAYTLTIIIILFSFPRIINNFTQNIASISSGNSFIVSDNEYSALEYLRTHANNDKLLLAAEYNTQEDGVGLYVPLLSMMPAFLNGNEITRSHGIRTDTRKELVTRIFTTEDKEELDLILKQNNIGYLYFRKSMKIPQIVRDPKSFRPFFKNDDVTVIEVM